MSKNYFILIVSLFCSISTVTGQCNIEKDNSKPKAIVYTAGSEELYRNIDLENGFSILNANFILMTQKEDKTKIKFLLVVTHKKSSYQSVVVPRKLTFAFLNGENLILDADELNSPIIRGDIIFNTCYYRVNLDKIEIIRTHALKSFSVTDSRSGEKIYSTPYSNIFVEQINCLFKKSDE